MDRISVREIHLFYCKVDEHRIFILAISSSWLLYGLPVLFNILQNAINFSHLGQDLPLTSLAQHNLQNLAGADIGCEVAAIRRLNDAVAGMQQTLIGGQLGRQLRHGLVNAVGVPVL